MTPAEGFWYGRISRKCFSPNEGNGYKIPLISTILYGRLSALT